MAQQLDLIPSTRKRKNGEIAYKGILNCFIYVEEKRSADKITWVCEEKRKSLCGARLQTNLSMQVVNAQRNVHRNHIAESSKVEVMEAMIALKRRAVETQEPSSKIVNTALHCTSAVATAHLPLTDSLRRKVCRHRVAELGEAASFDIPSMVIPHRFKYYQQINSAAGHGCSSLVTPGQGDQHEEAGTPTQGQINSVQAAV
uniref:FLYWCH-type domain-containing protein n=1 Tax=Plectus sambesii TaxID=2011161 RepID=A0A914XE27_9BILA